MLVSLPGEVGQQRKRVVKPATFIVLWTSQPLGEPLWLSPVFSLWPLLGDALSPSASTWWVIETGKAGGNCNAGQTYQREESEVKASRSLSWFHVSPTNICHNQEQLKLITATYRPCLAQRCRPRNMELPAFGTSKSNEKGWHHKKLSQCSMISK